MKKLTKIILIVLPVLLVGGIVWGSIALQKNKQPKIETTIAKRTTIIQEVSTTGKVKPAQAVDLAFEQNGKVVSVRAKVGDKVIAGQVLIYLDQTGTKAQLDQAKAALDKAQADLDALNKGARTEDIQVSQTKKDNAQTSLTITQQKASLDLSNAYDNVNDVLHDAYASAFEAINKYTDDLFNNDFSDNPTLSFQSTETQKETAVKSQRILANQELTKMQIAVANLTSDYSQQDVALLSCEANLQIIRDFLNSTADILNYTAGVSQTTVETYKGYLASAKAEVNTAISSINTQKQTIASQKNTNQQNINTAQNAFDLATQELALKIAKATPEQIQAQVAQVASARANVENIQAQYQKTMIITPISGIVAKVDAKVGEIAQAQKVVASVLSEAEFEIETFIPEADIAKVKLGDMAKITLDAYTNDVKFEAKVVVIDLAETVLEGVSTYKTILQFSQKDERIKSGMTTNLDILTAQKDNVIAVPNRAVAQKNGDKIVKVLQKDRKTIKEVIVETGLRGSDGNIEIVSGINEGDNVVIFSE